METQTTSSSLLKKDLAHLWHPFTQMQTASFPIPIQRAEGLYLYAEGGKRYLDGISSWWVNLHGHAHPYIVEKLCEQAKKLDHVIFADFTHGPAVDLAERLLSILPGNMSKIFYSDNGSTAVETALKMALQFWHNQQIPKTKVVCFQGSYHGDTFGSMAAAGKNRWHKPFWNHLFQAICIPPPLAGKEAESLKQLEEVLAQGDVACFIFEPLVLGCGGMMIYPPEGLNALLGCCRKHAILTIADEVMTGFGRTGLLFACEMLTEQPDLICLSKGITGGFLPLGATACNEKIFNAFLSDELQYALLHGHSYTGNPLACACALASLDLLLTEKCSKQRACIASCHQSACQKWQANPKLKRCETLGTLLALEYKTTGDSSYFQLSLRDWLYSFFIDQGILLRPLGNVLYLLPPYCIQEAELQQIYNQITRTLEVLP